MATTPIAQTPEQIAAAQPSNNYTSTNQAASTNPAANVNTNPTASGNYGYAGYMDYSSNPNGTYVGTANNGAQSTTALSSNKTPDILNAQNTTAKYAQGGVTTDPSTGVSTSANGSSYAPYTPPESTPAPSSGITSTGGYVGETYYAPGSTLPTDSSGNYLPTTANSPSSDAILKSLNDQKTSADALTSSMISNIEAQYASLQNQQIQINAGNNAASQGALFRSGAAQGDAYSQNTQNAQIQKGVDALSDLATKKQTAILQAQQAGQNNDFQLQEQINNQIASIAKDQAAAGQKVQDQIQASKDLITKQKQQNQDDVNSVVEELDKVGAPASVIAAAKASNDKSTALAAAGNYLQTSSDPQMNRYIQARNAAQANGVAPPDYNTWVAQDDKLQAKEKASEAYSTAYASAAGKSAADASAAAKDAQITVPVQNGDNGVIYNVPVNAQPYVNFASSGTPYLDSSTLQGTAAEKSAIINGASAAGVKVINNKNSAADLTNIANAKSNIYDIQNAFDAITATSALARNTFAAGTATLESFFQLDPSKSSVGVFNAAVPELVKAINGVQGSKGGAGVTDDSPLIPKITDTIAQVNAKMDKINSLLDNRETAIVGKPTAGQQHVIDEKTAESKLTSNLNAIKTSNPKLFQAASSMYTSNNPDTGQPYSASDILQAFSELNK